MSHGKMLAEVQGSVRTVRGGGTENRSWQGKGRGKTDANSPLMLSPLPLLHFSS